MITDIATVVIHFLYNILKHMFDRNSKITSETITYGYTSTVYISRIIDCMLSSDTAASSSLSRNTY